MAKNPDFEKKINRDREGKFADKNKAQTPTVHHTDNTGEGNPGGVTGGTGENLNLDQINHRMSVLDDKAGELAERNVDTRAIMPGDTVMQTGEYGTNLTREQYEELFPTRLDRARYEAWVNNPEDGSTYDVRLTDNWDDADKLNELSAKSPLWDDMNTSFGAYETESEISWEEVGCECDPEEALPTSHMEYQLKHGGDIKEIWDTRHAVRVSFPDLLRDRPDIRVRSPKQGEIYLNSTKIKGHGVAIVAYAHAFAVKNRPRINGGYEEHDDYATYEYGGKTGRSVEEALQAATRDAAKRL